MMSVVFMSSLARTGDPHLEVRVPLMHLFRLKKQRKVAVCFSRYGWNGGYFRYGGGFLGLSREMKILRKLF